MTNTRKKLLIGNWKMFKNASTAQADFVSLVSSLKKEKLNIEVGIAAPAVFLADLATKTENVVTLYAQNSHWMNEGAFTGEISVPMLQSIQVAGSLVAHSERRQMFGETNKTAGMRMGALLKAGMKAVYCIGETLAEREQGLLESVITTQLKEAIEAANLKDAQEYLGKNPNGSLFSIAYEPVWAIGTGKAATSVEAQAAHKLIADLLESIFDKNTASRIPILYGGSVKLNNIKEYVQCPNISGGLVGGASLVPADFVSLCKVVSES